MMRRLLAFLLILIAAPQLRAQDQAVTVDRVFTAEAPPDYATTYGEVDWSPDGSLIGIEFTTIEANNGPGEALWRIYDVETGELLGEYADLIAWYAGSSRILVRAAGDTIPRIVDSRTGRVEAALDGAGTIFAPRPIEDRIVNLDVQTHTLRIYDSDSGALRFTLHDVAGMPAYAPDRSRLAVTIMGRGVQVYSAADFTLLDTLDGYRLGGPWSPDGRRLLVIPADSLYTVLGPRYIWTPGAGLSAPLYDVTGGIVWSPDGTRIAAASDYTKVRLYAATTGALLETIRGFPDGPTGSLQWEGHYLLALSGDNAFTTPFAVSVWDFDRGAFAGRKGLDVGFDYWLADGELVTFEPYFGVHFISLETGETTRTIAFDEVPLNYLSPDRRWIAAPDVPFEAGVPAPVRLYRLDPLERIATLEGHTEIVRYVSWSPDSRRFASIGGPNIVILWELVVSPAG